MNLLQPRRVYHRTNSDDAHFHDAVDMISLDPHNDDSRSSHSNLDDALRSQQDHFQNSTSEFGNDDNQRSVDQDQPSILRPSSRAKWFSGWRTGAYTAAGIALCSLIINIVAVIWLKRHPNADSSLVEVFNGNCSTVSRMDIWVHLLINAISTLLLGGSNYCMQCLCAPTRTEIDRAHAKDKFLDIGVPSYRNLAYIARSRHLMWWILALSSLPLHLLYNSAFYSSLSANDYDIYFVTPDFLRGGNATDPEPDSSKFKQLGTSPVDIQKDIASNSTHKFDQLEVRNCIHDYAQVLLSNRRNLVFVVKTNATVNGSTVIDSQSYSFERSVNLGGQSYAPFDWICTSDPDIGSKTTIPRSLDHHTPCDSYVDRVEAIANQWTPWGHEIDYCLSEIIEESCSFNGNLPIIIIVIVANSIKVIIMFIVAYRLGDNPLITVGDAVENFLETPDERTKNMGHPTRSHIIDYLYANSTSNFQPVVDGERLVEEIDSKMVVRSPKAMRWSGAASRNRWKLTIGLMAAALITVLGFFVAAINAIKLNGASFPNLGFGQLHISAIISGWSIDDIKNPSTRILAAIFIANLPQAILSFLYLNLNGLLTSMWTALEWSHFATERKALRVSTPKGQQRSTHFLQLPYKIAIPLMVVSGLLHWLVSQSIFLAVIAEYGPKDGVLVNPTQIASCGFSPLAMIIVIALGLLIIAGCFLIGRFEYDPAMPFAGSSSLAIAAACHRPNWDVDASVLPVLWGVIPGSEQTNGVGLCAFSSGSVEPLQEGKEYANLTSRR